MIAVNAFTDRILECAASKPEAEFTLYGSDVPYGVRLYHDPVFESTSSDIGGLLSLELASYLRDHVANFAEGALCFNVSVDHFWHDTSCRIRVAFFEVYATAGDLLYRREELAHMEELERLTA